MKTTIAGLLLTVVVTASLQADPVLEDYSRAGKGEIYGFGEALLGWDETTFESGSISLDMGTAYGGGIGLGFNVIDNLNINTEFAVAGVDLDGTMMGTTVPGDATLWRWGVGVDFNILKTRLTPLVTANVGVMHLTGDFSSEEFRETDLNYGVGGGVRWDVSDNWFLKAVYRVNWINLEDSDDATMYQSVTVGIGYAF